MKFDREAILHLGRLAKIELSEEEQKTIPQELSSILSVAEQLGEVDISGVEPTAQVTGLENVERDDMSNYVFPREEMTAMMPKTDDQGNLVVHAVFTGDSPSH